MLELSAKKKSKRSTKSEETGFRLLHTLVLLISSHYHKHSRLLTFTSLSFFLDKLLINSREREFELEGKKYQNYVSNEAIHDT